MHLWQVILFPSSSSVFYSLTGKAFDSFTTSNAFSCGREGRAGVSISQQGQRKRRKVAGETQAKTENGLGSP